MPGDGHPRDKMYMSFRLQYMDTSKQWVDASSAKSRSSRLGTGASARQGGNSFKFVRGVSPFILRGVVDFQWRRGTRVLWSAARTTTAGHHNASDADPAGSARLAARSADRRGSLVMMPSTPIAVSLSIIRASSTVHT